MKKIQQILCLLTCLLLVAAIAIRRDNRVFGHDLSPATETQNEFGDTLSVLPDGTTVVNTAPLGSKVYGYGGKVPMTIYLKDGKVAKVEAQPNSETPDFFEEAKAILDSWTGKTIQEAIDLPVDAVSGATYSSDAIIENVRLGLAYASANGPEAAPKPYKFQAKEIAAIVVILLAMIVPLFYKNRRWHYVQIVLNIAILGFWCGTFLSFDKMMGMASGGIAFPAGIASVLMLIAAFIYPLFGKKNYYCTHICPCGSLQDLAGKCSKRKLRIPPKVAKGLETFRTILFAVLMLLMLLGVFFEWTGYEIFTAFIFKTASVGVLVFVGVVVVLAVFTPRPYCRFICPTGTLFKLSQDSK